MDNIESNSSGKKIPFLVVAVMHYSEAMFKPKTIAIFEMLIADAIWGFGFIATYYALPMIGPNAMTALRFFLSLVICFPLIINPILKNGAREFQFFRLAFWPGTVLGIVLVLQTWGLKYTTPTKSGFITTLYVVFVPFAEVILKRKKKLSVGHMGCVFVALFGTALICEYKGEAINLGDLLTFGCALMAVVHILLVDSISKKIDSSLVFNCYQSFWGMFPALFLLTFVNEPFGQFSWISVFGVGWLVVMSTTVGFMLQVKTQKVLAPSLASILFLLESPFAALFSFVFLGERLSWLQWGGGALILVACIGAIRISRTSELAPHTI